MPGGARAGAFDLHDIITFHANYQSKNAICFSFVSKASCHLFSIEDGEFL